jgi:hypothetical protein
MDPWPLIVAAAYAVTVAAAVACVQRARRRRWECAEVGKASVAMDRLQEALDRAKGRHQRNQVRQATELAAAAEAGWTAEHEARVDALVAQLDSIAPEPPADDASPATA